MESSCKFGSGNMDVSCVLVLLEVTGKGAAAGLDASISKWLQVGSGIFRMKRLFLRVVRRLPSTMIRYCWFSSFSTTIPVLFHRKG